MTLLLNTPQIWFLQQKVGSVHLGVGRGKCIWIQAAKVKRSIVIANKHISHGIGDSRITLELQTALMEISDMCNERPITAAKPCGDKTYSLVTQNMLLI